MENITLSKKEYDRKMSFSSNSGIAVGFIGVGVSLLFFKEVQKHNSYAVIGAGVFFLGLSILFNYIDKQAIEQEKKLEEQGYTKQ